MSIVRTCIDRITATPQNLFWAFVLTHLTLWTVIPSLVSPNLPLDVIEGYAWGKEWLIGTHKHPPMQAWVLETLYALTGRARWAPYLASQIALVTAFWAVWRTGCKIVSPQAALVGVLLLEGISYYNFTSPEFNPNVLQIPFWALAGWSFHKAIKDNKIVDWFLLGAWVAGGMYSKYSTGLFALVLFLSMLAHRDGRRRFLSPGPYLALATALILFLPHLLWLVHNNFLPLQYTLGRFERNSPQYSATITTLLLVAGQFLALMFAFLLMIILYDRRRAPSQAPAPSFDRVFLTFAAFGPFLAMFCMSLILGYHIRDMWQTPFWNFIGLWAVVFIRPSLMPNDLRRFTFAFIFVFATGLIVFVANESLSPYVTSKPKRTIFPGKRLSQRIIDEWHHRYNTQLNYVVGDVWPAGNVAWYADDRPHVLLEGDFSISPWVSKSELAKDGGVIVWCVQCGGLNNQFNMPDYLKSGFPQAIVQDPIELARMTYAHVPTAIVGWAIIPPQDAPIVK